MKLKAKARCVPGHDQFGLKNVKIAKLIEQLPGEHLPDCE